MSLSLICKILDSADAFRALGDRVGASTQIGTNEFVLLDLLLWSLENRAPLSQIKKHLALPAPSLSRIITRLVQKAYVKRDVEPADSRMLSLQLTETGKQAFIKTKALYTDTVEAILRDIPLSKKGDLENTLRLLCTTASTYSQK